MAAPDQPAATPLGRALVAPLAFGTGYTLLAIALTWPLTAHAATHLPRDLGDPLLTAWLLTWHATLTPFTDAWWNGAAFFPLKDTLALSDHRVGLSLVSTPVLWLGGSPALAYNTTLVLGVALSALGAHALVHRLTARHDAACIAGLAFGFAPYRFDHLEHLELVATWWLPLTLIGLHAWRTTHRPRWLLLAATAWMLQGLTGGYYFVYGFVLLAAWLAWFVPPREWRVESGPLVAAFGVALTPLLPVLWRYRAVHDRLGLTRSLDEVERFSADLSGLLSGSQWLDRVPGVAALHRPEGQLYPGLVAVGLVAAMLWRARRKSAASPAPLPPFRRACLAVAVGAAALAAVSGPFGPWSIDLGGVALSLTHVHKPVTVAILALLAFALSSPRVRQAWREQSPFVFYALATPLCWALALGPTGHLGGERFWYKAPYAWLMLVPGMGAGFRVPARFGMLAALTLAVAAGLAVARMRIPAGCRWGVTAALGAVLLLDVWPGPIRAVAVPALADASAIQQGGAAVVELPLGTVTDDVAAQYRQLAHWLPVVNGYSGHEPPHMALLRVALADRDPRALDAWRRQGRILVGLDAHDPHGEWARYVTGLGGREAGTAGERRYLALDAIGPAPAMTTCDALPIARIDADDGEEPAGALNDGTASTWWATRGPQQGTESLRIDLGGRRHLCGLRIVQGRALLGEFPRRLDIAASTDGEAWTRVWEGQTAGLAVEAALRDATQVAIDIPVTGGTARYLRLRQVGRSDRHHWAATEIEVRGER